MLGTLWFFFWRQNAVIAPVRAKIGQRVVVRVQP